MKSRTRYRWFYDHLQSCYYDVATRWCFIPFGSESNCRRGLIAGITWSGRDKILDMCCGTGNATRTMAARGGFEGRIMRKDLCVRRIGRAFALASFVFLGLVSPWAHPHTHAQGQETMERTEALQPESLQPEGTSPFDILWQFDTGG